MFAFWDEGEAIAASVVDYLMDKSWSCFSKDSTMGDLTEPTMPSTWGLGLGFSTLCVGRSASGMISYRIPD